MKRSRLLQKNTLQKTQDSCEPPLTSKDAGPREIRAFPTDKRGGCAAESQVTQQRQEPTRDLLPCAPRGAPLLRPAGCKPPRNFHLHRKESRGLREQRPAHADPCEICSFPAGNGGLCIFGRFRTRNEGVCIASRGQRNPNPAETPGQMQESEDLVLKSRANPSILCTKTGFPADPPINLRPSRRKSRGLRDREPTRAKRRGPARTAPSPAPCGAQTPAKLALFPQEMKEPV